MDPGLVCRILGWFRAQRYLAEAKDPEDERTKIVELNPRGQDAFRRLQASAADTAEFMLMQLQPGDRDRLIAAFAAIDSILRAARWEEIRPPR